MVSSSPNREEAFTLLREFNTNESLINHAIAVDELTGLITACVLVRPSKSVMDLTAKSVLKKWKQKGFAAGADRGIIEKGAEMLGVEIGELISDTIMGMRE